MEDTADRQESREDDDKKTFDAEYVAKLRAEAADYRTRAKANADAAEELARIREERKEEAAQAEAHAASLQAATDKAEKNLRRLTVAMTHGISLEDAELFLTADDEETLTKQAERLKAREPAARRGAYVPNEGKTPEPGKGKTLRDVTRAIFPAH